MTISILAFDENLGAYGGAATTGSLCVGGWVLRGDAESGMSAAQGSLPSVMWGTRVLELMRAGAPAAEAVAEVTGRDAGRAERQLAALDPAGRTGAFTGANSVPAAAARQARHVVVTGNLLSGEHVLDACLEGFLAAQGGLDLRLLRALEAAAGAGGDSRGLLSAALLAVSRRAPPLSLRVDYSTDPLGDLAVLHEKATTGLYADWARHVPVLDDPERAAPFGSVERPV